MIITLGVSQSEKNKIGKSFTSQVSYEGYLRDETSIIDPVIMMEMENPTGFNYAYIPEFGRYYFITDIVSVRTNLWRLSMHVDVIESFRNELQNCTCILSDTENAGANEYLPGDVWRGLVKELTDIKVFPNGLSESGHFILITAGG